GVPWVQVVHFHPIWPTRPGRIRHVSSSTFELRLATQPVLEDIAREGARRMLQHAIEQEVAGYIDAHREMVDERGHRLVARNGHKTPRTLLTGCGPIEVRQ